MPPPLGTKSAFSCRPPSRRPADSPELVGFAQIPDRLRSVDAWVLLRFAKFAGVALLSCGVLGSVFLRGQRERQICAYVVATMGLLIVWTAGYGLVKAKGLSISEPWISRSLLAGLAAIFGAAWAASSAVVARWTRALAVGALTAAFGLMSARDGNVALTIVAPVLAAAPVLLVPTPPSDPDTPPVDSQATFRWFAWLARAEGTSLLLLFGVYMPLKYGAGIVLDGGQGWFGWIHGVLQLLFVVALLVTVRTYRWSMLRAVVGFVASLVPLGTFIFESRVRPRS